MICVHCKRGIEQDAEGGWVDPEAAGDDSIWRETCDSHDTFTAEHEPFDHEPMLPAPGVENVPADECGECGLVH